MCHFHGAGAGRDGSAEGQQLPDWSSLGGLQPVIRQLKEMVILPLLYPTLYRQMGITAPRSAPLVLGTIVPWGGQLSNVTTWLSLLCLQASRPNQVVTPMGRLGLFVRGRKSRD